MIDHQRAAHRGRCSSTTSNRQATRIGRQLSSLMQAAVHSLTLDDLKIAFTVDNRDTLHQHQQSYSLNNDMDQKSTLCVSSLLVDDQRLRDR